MSERVRYAMALDTVEDATRVFCYEARAKAMGAEHVQNELTCRFSDIGMIAAVYGVDPCDLRRDAMRMLHDDLRRSLCGVCDVRYVKPYVEDGMEVGMTVKFYKIGRRVA